MVFKEHQTRDQAIFADYRLMELHLYPGNRCNRECSFCTVFGSPRGELVEYVPEHLDVALKMVTLDQQGALKFYGGEPTLNHENVIWAIAYLRQRHYQGAIVIYSNGIQAERLIQILESDASGKTTAALNYSIATGDGAASMPPQALEKLRVYELEHPETIAIGHPDVVDSGRGIEPFTGAANRSHENSRCPHCYPVLTTAGKFHACPFAVENQSAHFQLGTLGTHPATVAQNFRTFLAWIDTVHEPYAVQHGLEACTVCWKHLNDLPVPAFANQNPSQLPTQSTPVDFRP
ncbi:MAG: hypothetical protein F6K19_35555 [Cyanothece sp. SIO1E1]|nr:hypothetical protein [Cyanothece sp. SIO1E1]